jgi:hypothetical protein
MSTTAPTPDTAGPTADACPNCGELLAGRYCHRCGQKRIEPAERRFSWFVAQAVREVTLVDGRLLRSVGNLLLRPGVLDRDWLAGRRRANMAPLSLFLLANLLYFFHPPLSDLNLSLYDQLGQDIYRDLARALVQARLEARDITMEAYAATYAQQAGSLAKLMVILHVPIMGAVLMALHFRRRIFYVDHIAVALHYWAFLLIHFMATPFLLLVLQRTTGFGSRGVLQVVILIGLLLYAWQQMRVAYSQPGWLAALKLPLLAVGIMATHMLYRFIQFLAVLATT